MSRSYHTTSMDSSQPGALSSSAGAPIPLVSHAPLSLSHRVRTPENVEFEFALGSLPGRFLAWMFDNALVAGIVILGLMLLSLAFRTSLGEMRVGFAGGLLGFLGALVVFAGQWGYFVFCEWWTNGATPGKRLLRLRVIALDGVRPTFQQCVLRNLFRMVDSFPIAAVTMADSVWWHLFPIFLLPGALTAFLSPQSRRLGDYVAGTLVVEERRRPLPSAIVPPKERYNTFIEDPRVADRLHRGLEPAQAEALVALCLRRDELELASRLNLFGRATALLERRLSLPKPEHFSDEKYVLNLVAVLIGREADARPRGPRA